MAMQRWDPYGEMRSLRSAMDRLMQDAYVWPGATGTTQSTQTPPLDVVERENELVVRAALPGVKPEDVDVTVQGNTLTITGETRSEDEKNGTVHHRENRYGKFTRSITFPTRVDSEKCEATFEHGVLTLTLPKAEASRMRRIPVTSQAPQIETTATKSHETQAKSETPGTPGNGKKPAETRK